MGRFQIALIVACVLSISASAEDAPKPKVDDPIAAELTKAKMEYQTAVAKAKVKMIDAFSDQRKRLEDNKRLKVDEVIKLIEKLQAEEKAFKSDATNIPKSPSMKVAVSDYQTSVDAARKKCEAAFVMAAEKYREKKDLATAKIILDGKEQFLSGALAVSLVAANKKSIAGDYKDNLGRATSFTEDGKSSLYLPAKKQYVRGTWIQKGEKFEITWSTGARDIVEFDKNGKDLIGKAVSPEKMEHDRTFIAVSKK